MEAFFGSVVAVIFVDCLLELGGLEFLALDEEQDFVPFLCDQSRRDASAAPCPLD
jgi:hypothetical protein